MNLAPSKVYTARKVLHTPSNANKGNEHTLFGGSQWDILFRKAIAENDPPAKQLFSLPFRLAVINETVAWYLLLPNLIWLTVSRDHYFEAAVVAKKNSTTTTTRTNKQNSLGIKSSKQCKESMRQSKSTIHSVFGIANELCIVVVVVVFPILLVLLSSFQTDSPSHWIFIHITGSS